MKKLITALFMTLMLSLTLNAAEVKQTKEIVLTTDNTIALRDSFNETSVAKLMAKATELNSKLPSGYPIYLFLYTPGGSIQDGLELFEMLKGLNRPVHTITLFSASMGFQTVQQLGERYILKYGTLMSHKARGGFSGEFGDGASQLDSRYGQWLRRIAIMDNDTVARTKGKQTLQSYRAAYAPELWMNGQEAVDQGYADEVVSVKCEESLAGKVESETFDFGFFAVEASFSSCPVRTAPLSVSAILSTNQGKMSVEQFAQKGGKYGTECRNAAEVKTSWNSDATTSVPAELCLVDGSITLDTLKKAMKEKSEYLRRDLKANVIYSY